jgi:hypothetical protein
MIDTTVCSDHNHCAVITKERFKDLLEKVIKCAPQITGAIETYMFPQWMMGQIIIDEMLEKNLWSIEGCCFCYVESFLSHEGRHPWIIVFEVSWRR